MTQIAKAVLLGLLAAQAADAASPTRPARGWESAAGQETKTVFALTGDAIINRRLSTFRAPGVDDLFGVIRQADVAFTNFETLIHDFTMAGAQQSGGTYMGSPRFISEDYGALQLLERMTGDSELKRIQIVIRPHPQFNDRLHKVLGTIRERFPHVVIQGPQRSGPDDAPCPTDEGIVEWVNTMRHADIVVNLCSSIVLKMILESYIYRYKFIK